MYRVWVKCPKCSKVQKTESLKQKKCVYCGHTFVIFPKYQKSRVVKVEGNVQRYFLDVSKLRR